MEELVGFDPEKFSLRELLDLNMGSLIDRLARQRTELRAHVLQCQVRDGWPSGRLLTGPSRAQRCQAKGHICEICQDPTPFYSFDLDIAVQCPNCLGFFHQVCFDENACPRCLRRRMRELQEARDDAQK